MCSASVERPVRCFTPPMVSRISSREFFFKTKASASFTALSRAQAWCPVYAMMGIWWRTRLMRSSKSQRRCLPAKGSTITISALRTRRLNSDLNGLVHTVTSWPSVAQLFPEEVGHRIVLVQNQPPGHNSGSLFQIAVLHIYESRQLEVNGVFSPLGISAILQGNLDKYPGILGPPRVFERAPQEGQVPRGRPWLLRSTLSWGIRPIVPILNPQSGSADLRGTHRL